jgi:hypothetical protein
MSGYEDATPEVQAATDRMMAEVEQAGLDYAKVAAIAVGMSLDEEALMLLRTGSTRGSRPPSNG